MFQYGEDRKGVEAEGTPDHDEVVEPVVGNLHGAVLTDLLDHYEEGRREGEGADHGGGFLEQEMLLGKHLPVTGILCGVQLGSCHDVPAWLLSSSCVDWGGVHGSHGEGYHV